MHINTKKTETMVIKKETDDCSVKIEMDGEVLEQVKKYKYIGSLITDDCKCIEEVKARIMQAKIEFWKCKEFLRRDISLKLKLKLLNCHIKTVMSYGSEAWTYNSEVVRRINAFQMWCYRRMMKDDEDILYTKSNKHRRNGKGRSKSEMGR